MPFDNRKIYDYLIIFDNCFMILFTVNYKNMLFNFKTEYINNFDKLKQKYLKENNKKNVIDGINKNTKITFIYTKKFYDDFAEDRLDDNSPLRNLRNVFDRIRGIQAFLNGQINYILYKIKEERTNVITSLHYFNNIYNILIEDIVKYPIMVYFDGLFYLSTNIDKEISDQTRSLYLDFKPVYKTSTSMFIYSITSFDDWIWAYE